MLDYRALHFIAAKEAIVPAPYLDSANVWTFGIGHTAKAGPPDPSKMPRGMPGNVNDAITRAVRLFQDRIDGYEQDVRRVVRITLTHNELAALTSFHFNTGGILTSSGVAKLNAGDRAGAWKIFEQWNKVTQGDRKVVSQGLVDRRRAEKDLFFRGVYPNLPIPVWRVGPNNRPILSSPVRMISEADFAQMLDATARVVATPEIPTVSTPSFWELILRLFRGTSRGAQVESPILGYTGNAVPIYRTAADYPNWRWSNFKPTEMACKGTGRLAVDPAAMDKLQALRRAIGKPFKINSAYRSPEHNRAVGGAPNSKHMLGIAFDIDMRGHDRDEFKAAARRLGFTGIGNYPTFIHIDTRSGGLAEW